MCVFFKNFLSNLFCFQKNVLEINIVLKDFKNVLRLFTNFEDKIDGVMLFYYLSTIDNPRNNLAIVSSLNVTYSACSWIVVFSLIAVDYSRFVTRIEIFVENFRFHVAIMPGSNERYIHALYLLNFNVSTYVHYIILISAGWFFNQVIS